MIKKILIGTTAAAVMATFVFGRDVVSVIRSGSDSFRSAVHEEIPLDFEVKRARDMVESLVPDIRTCMQSIAEQQVEIDYLAGEIASKESSMADEKSRILALRDELRSGKQKIQLASESRAYTPLEVKHDLEKRFKRFKSAEENLDRDRQILDARRKAVQANMDRLEKMMSQKQELEVKLAQLEARLKTVQAAESVSDLEIDDSQLTRAKKLINSLDRQLDVRQRMLDNEGNFTGLIPVDLEAEATGDVTSDIDSYFHTSSEEISDEEIVVEPSA